MLRRFSFWLAATVVLLLLVSAVLVFSPRLNGSDGSAPLRSAALTVVTETLKTDLGPVRIVAARFDPRSVTVRVVDRHHGIKDAGATAGQVCPNHGAAINASFFAQDLTPLGLIIQDGRRCYPHLKNEGWYGKWGLFLMYNGQPAIIADTDPFPAEAELVLQCGPRLVINGAIPPFKRRGKANRSAVGIDADGRVLFAVADGWITFETWAAILRDRLHCVDALNLDGGPSTQLAVRGETPADVPGGWPVPVFLTAKPRSFSAAH